MSATVPEAEFELKGGARLRLYANRVVHEGAGVLEIVPYAHLASVRVAFERDARKLNWAIVLTLVALALVALAGPMQGWFASLAASAKEGSHRETIEAALLATFNALRSLARLLPALAAVLFVGAAALALLFALGRTTLTLHFAAAERAFGRLGRDRRLMEFAEILGERLAERAK